MSSEKEALAAREPLFQQHREETHPGPQTPPPAYAELQSNPGQVPQFPVPEQYPQPGQNPPGNYPPAGQYPPGPYPPAGQYPPGPHPPAGQYPQGQYPAASYQPSQYPPGQYQPGHYPPGQFVPNQYPQDHAGKHQQQTNVVVVGQPRSQTGYVYPVGATPPNYLGLAIFSCLCCFWPTGICAIVAAANANSSVSAGDMVGANRSSRNARNLSIISIVLGIICITLTIILRVTAYSSYHWYY